MAATLAGLVREWQRVKTELLAVPQQPIDLTQYAADPVGYARDILGVNLTPDQEAILRHLLIPPCMVDVPSGHSTGKSFVAAIAVCWWFDCIPNSICYSVAPRHEHVVTVLWGQIRLLRARSKVPLHSPWIGPKAPQLYDGPEHFAVGLTASRGESFHGRHLGRKLFILEEATGLHAMYFSGLRTMFDPTTGDAVLMIFNPYDSTSAAYIEDTIAQDADQKVWHRFRLNALDHPDVTAELKGEPRRFPGAVNLSMIEGWFRDYCEPVVEKEDVRVTDVLWPPAWTKKPGQWYRPGPEFQVKALGLWPDTGAGVWSDSLWTACERRELPWNVGTLPQVGCDTAMGKGDDWHAIHCQWGGVSLPEGHQTANTMDPAIIAGKLRDMAAYAARFATMHRDSKAAPVEPKRISIAIDDDGVGNAIWAFLAREGWNIRAVGAGCASSQPQRYRRRRDELWFSTAEKARRGGVSFALLDKATQRRLKQQLLAPAWDMDGAGRRCVEEKDKTKEKLGRSPDDADATNLAFLEVGATAPSVVELPEDTEYKGGHYAKRRQGGRWGRES